MDTCEYHITLVSDIAVIKSSLDTIKDKICSHITQGEEKGGFRDRLIILEQEVKVIKQGYWKAALVAGILGGLIGNLSPDLIQGIAKLIGLIK